MPMRWIVCPECGGAGGWWNWDLAGNRVWEICWRCDGNKHIIQETEESSE